MALNLKEVDGIAIEAKHKASCHCGSVEFELDLPDGLIDLHRCDCSFCRRRGAIAASISLSGIKILKGESLLKLYQFNTKTGKGLGFSKANYQLVPKSLAALLGPLAALATKEYV